MLVTPVKWSRTMVLVLFSRYSQPFFSRPFCFVAVYQYSIVVNAIIEMHEMMNHDSTVVDIKMISPSREYFKAMLATFNIQQTDLLLIFKPI